MRHVCASPGQCDIKMKKPIQAKQKNIIQSQSNAVIISNVKTCYFSDDNEDIFLVV